MCMRRASRSPTARAPNSVRVLALVALTLAACTTAPTVVQPTPVPTREPNTVNVSVLLDLSGPRAPSGQPQRSAMQVWLDQIQADTTAIKLRVKFVDVAGSDAKVLLELRHAALDERADVIVVGVPVSLDGSFGDAVQVASIPVLLTLPVSEPMTTPAGRFVFALAPTTDVVARTLASDIIGRGAVAPIVLVSDESATAVTERLAFVAELRRLGLTPPSPLLMSQPDAAQRVATAAAAAKSVVLSGASAGYGDIIRALPATRAATVYLSYLTETTDVISLREQTSVVTWPGSRWLATLSNEPLPGQRASFVRSFADRYGPPSTLAGSAFDALEIIEFAARLGPSELDAGRLRLRLETNTFAGVVTAYSFTPARHAGFPAGDLVLLRWSAQRGGQVVAPRPTASDR